MIAVRMRAWPIVWPTRWNDVMSGGYQRSMFCIRYPTMPPSVDWRQMHYFRTLQPIPLQRDEVYDMMLDQAEFMMCDASDCFDDGFAWANPEATAATGCPGR